MVRLSWEVGKIEEPYSHNQDGLVVERIFSWKVVSAGELIKFTYGVVIFDALRKVPSSYQGFCSGRKLQAGQASSV